MLPKLAKTNTKMFCPKTNNVKMVTVHEMQEIQEDIKKRLKVAHHGRPSLSRSATEQSYIIAWKFYHTQLCILFIHNNELFIHNKIRPLCQ